MGKIEELHNKMYESGSEKELQKRMKYREAFPETLRRPQRSWEEPKPAPKNLVPNGDFETGTDKMPAKWDHPAQWKTAHEGLVTTESRQAEKEGDHKGGKCAHFHVTKAVGENEGLQIFSDFFPVPEGGDLGAVYRFRLDGKKIGTGMITWVSFFTDDKRAPAYRAQFRPDCGGEWKTCERVFKVHVRAGQTKVHPERKFKWIQIELMGVYAGGDAWFDNVTLELLPPDTKVVEPEHPDPEPLFPGGKKAK